MALYTLVDGKKTPYEGQVFDNPNGAPAPGSTSSPETSSLTGKANAGLQKIAGDYADIPSQFLKGATWGYADNTIPTPPDAGIVHKVAAGAANLTGMGLGLLPVSKGLQVVGMLPKAAGIVGGLIRGAELGGIYGGARKPEEGETRLGNAVNDAKMFAGFEGAGGAIEHLASKLSPTIKGIFEKVQAGQPLTDAEQGLYSKFDYGRSAALGAGAGATEPAEDWQQRLTNIATGAGSFAGAHGISDAVGRAIKPTQAVGDIPEEQQGEPALYPQAPVASDNVGNYLKSPGTGGALDDLEQRTVRQPVIDSEALNPADLAAQRDAQFRQQFPQGLEPGGPEQAMAALPAGPITNALKSSYTPDFQLQGGPVEHVTPDVLSPERQKIAGLIEQKPLDVQGEPVSNPDDLLHDSKYGKIFDGTTMNRDALSDVIANQRDPNLAEQMATGREGKTTKEAVNAPQEISQAPGDRGEHQDGDVAREAVQASTGDSTVNAGPGEKAVDRGDAGKEVAPKKQLAQMVDDHFTGNEFTGPDKVAASKDSLDKIKTFAEQNNLPVPPIVEGSLSEATRALSPMAQKAKNIGKPPEPQQQGKVESGKPWEMTRKEFTAKFPESREGDYDRALFTAKIDGDITDADYNAKAIRDSRGVKFLWAQTRNEIASSGAGNVKSAKQERAEINKMKSDPKNFAKWRIDVMRRDANRDIAAAAEYNQGLLNVHKERVQEAITEGKPVPAEVLKDYPDLAKAEWEKSVARIKSGQLGQFIENDNKGKGESGKQLADYEASLPHNEKAAFDVMTKIQSSVPDIAKVSKRDYDTGSSNAKALINEKGGPAARSFFESKELSKDNDKVNSYWKGYADTLNDYFSRNPSKIVDLTSPDLQPKGAASEPVNKAAVPEKPPVRQDLPESRELSVVPEKSHVPPEATGAVGKGTDAGNPTRNVLTALIDKKNPTKDASKSVRQVANLRGTHGKDILNDLAQNHLISFPGGGLAEITKAGRDWLAQNPEPLNKVGMARYEKLSKQKKLTDTQTAELDRLAPRAKVTTKENVNGLPEVQQESGKGQEEVHDVRPQSQEPDTARGVAGKTAGEVADYGKNNKIFTEEKANAARDILRKKLSQVNSGLDPEMIQAGIELSGYHIEASARTFAEYSRKMIDELGEKVKPYLKSWYMAVRYHPGFDNKGMESEAAIEKADVAPLVERRKDTGRRKELAEMSPHELRRELFVDHLTGLGNKRAYEEVSKKPYQAIIDVDSLKWVNDTMNHDRGDELLKAVGKALAAETKYAYHLSGDEFAIHTASKSTLAEIVKRVESRLQDVAISHTLPDGSTITKKGVQFSHGIGETMDTADVALQLHKQEREASGLRGARGEEPPGVERGKSLPAHPDADILNVALRNVKDSEYGKIVIDTGRSDKGETNPTYPYPAGEERQSMNAAFDKLVSTFKTKETDKGTALYDITSVVPLALKELTRIGKAGTEAFPHLVTIGKEVYSKGVSTYQEFVKGMKEHLGDLWDKFKNGMIAVYQHVVKTFKDERGLFGPDINAGRVERDAWSTPQQKVSSASTSISYTDPEAKAPIIFSAFREGRIKLGPKNADIGGGRYDQITDWLKGKGVDNVVWDRFNRDEAHNSKAQKELAGGQADTATVSNVLNVIPDEANRAAVISTAHDSLKDGGKAYFSMYKAPIAGEVAKRDAFQVAKSPAEYIGEIEAIFGKGNVTQKGPIVIAEKNADTRGQFTDLTDRKAKVEIDDSGAKLKNLISPPPKPNPFGGDIITFDNIKHADGPLITILEHAALFKQFPDLANIDTLIAVTPSGPGGGAYKAFHKPAKNGKPEEIRVHAKTEAGALKELLHEVQHALQERGFFAKGGTAQDFGNYYEKIAGEEEARRASARSDMTAAERKGTPYDRTDIANPKDLIVKMEGGRADSVAAMSDQIDRLKDRAMDHPEVGKIAKSIGEALHDLTDGFRKTWTPASRGPEAKLTAENIREKNSGRQHLLDQITEHYDLARRLFDKMPDKMEDPEGAKARFIDAIQTGELDKLPADQREIAKSIYRTQDDLLKMVRDRGKLKSTMTTEEREQYNAQNEKEFMNYYFPGIWDKGSQDKAKQIVMERMAKRPLKGSGAFLKQKTIDLYSDGLRAGLKPLYDNPIDMLFHKSSEMAKWVMAKDIYDEMKKTGTMKMIPVDFHGPVGWMKIDDPSATIYGKNDVAGYRVKWTDADGEKQSKIFKPQPLSADDYASMKPAEREDAQWADAKDRADKYAEIVDGETEDARAGISIVGHLYAPEGAATVLNNMLSTGLRKNAAFRAYMGTANVANQMQLGFSAYHAGFTSAEAMVSQFALGLHYLADRDFGKAAKSFGGVPFAAVTSARLGRQMMQSWDNPSLHPDAVKFTAGGKTYDLNDLYSLGGGRMHMDQIYKTQITRNMQKLISQGNYISAALRAPFAGMEQMARPIMEHLVPWQKAGAFAKLAEMEISKATRAGKDLTHEELRAKMATIVDSIDNRMGQMIYDNTFWNKTAKDLAMASVRSVGWNVGTIREIIGGGQDMAKAVRNLSKGQKAELTTRMAYVVALPVLTGIMGAVGQYLMTGEGPDDVKDLYYPRTGGLDENGRPDRVVLPTYMKDVYHYATEPGKTLSNKLHPLLNYLAEMWQNKDYYGTKIRNEDDPLVVQAMDAVKHLGATMTPFAIRGAIKQSGLGAGPAETIAPFIGITPAPRAINQTAAERKMTEFGADKLPIGGRTQAEQDRFDLRRQIFRAIKTNDPDAPQLIADSTKSGQLSHGDITKIRNSAKNPPEVNHFKALTYDQAQIVFRIASPEEKQILGKYMMEKTRNEMQKKRGINLTE